MTSLSQLIQFLLLCCLSQGQGQGMREFCQEDALDLHCDTEEVFLVERARYGIMSLGKCVRTDYGYMGCENDVTHVLAGKCAGRRHCSVANIEALFIKVKTCPQDLKGYLEADIRCARVSTPAPISSCDVDGYVIATTPSLRPVTSLISSVTSQELGVGGANCPWLIEALPGQRVNVTLLDFTEYDIETAPISNNGGQHSKQIQGRFQSEGQRPEKVCRDLFSIEERSRSDEISRSNHKSKSDERSRLNSRSGKRSRSEDRSNTKVIKSCSDDSERTRHVFSSTTNRIRVTLLGGWDFAVSQGPGLQVGVLREGSGSSAGGAIFVVKYTIYGCARPSLAVTGHIILYEDESSVTLGCNHTSDTWVLRCVAGVWSGTSPTSNCSTVNHQQNLSSAAEVDKYMPYGMSLLVITVVAMCICLITLSLGLCYLRAKRKGRRTQQLYIQQLTAAAADDRSMFCGTLASYQLQPNPHTARKAITLPRHQANRPSLYSYTPVTPVSLRDRGHGQGSFRNQGSFRARTNDQGSFRERSLGQGLMRPPGQFSTCVRPAGLPVQTVLDDNDERGEGISTPTRGVQSPHHQWQPPQFYQTSSPVTSRQATTSPRHVVMTTPQCTCTVGRQDWWRGVGNGLPSPGIRERGDMPPPPCTTFKPPSADRSYDSPALTRPGFDSREDSMNNSGAWTPLSGGEPPGRVQGGLSPWSDRWTDDCPTVPSNNISI